MCLFCSCSCLVSTIIEYLNFDVVTFTHQINEKESQFPTISFCGEEKNLNISIESFWFNDEDLEINWQNQIETYDDYVFGRCFRFNSGKNITKHKIPIKNSKRSGWSTGFSIQFD